MLFKMSNYSALLVCLLYDAIPSFVFSTTRFLYIYPVRKLITQMGAEHLYNHAPCSLLIYFSSNIFIYLGIRQIILNAIKKIFHTNRRPIYTLNVIVVVLILNLILDYELHSIVQYKELAKVILNAILIGTTILWISDIFIISKSLVSKKSLHIRWRLMYWVSCIVSTAFIISTSHRYNYETFIKLLLMWINFPLLTQCRKYLKSYFYRIIQSYHNNIGSQSNIIFTNSRRQIIRISLIADYFLKYTSFCIFLLSIVYILDQSSLSIMLYIPHLKTTTRIIIVFIIGYIATFIINYIFTRQAEYSASIMPFDQQRIQTFSHIVKIVCQILLWIVCVFVMLSVLGIGIAPLFNSIGLFSAAISLSVQSFIRDIVNGILILYDRSIQLNDIIEIDGKTAIVEDMSLRYIRARYDDGTLCTVPFHKIDIIRNRNRKYTAAILNISFDPSVEVEIAEAAIRDAFAIVKDQIDMRRIVRSIEMRDIVDFTSFSYVMQVKVSAVYNHSNRVKRRFIRILKQIFEERSIKIAIPAVSNALTVPSVSTGGAYTDFD